MHLFIVRHGECFGNVDATRHSGPDTALTPFGEAQATRAAERLTELGITHVVSSPLLRALATAQIIAEGANIADIVVAMDLREGNHGAYWCAPRSRLAAAAPKAILPTELGETGWLHQTVDNAEFTLRCERVIGWLKAPFAPADRVVLVTHGLLGSNLLHVLLGIAWARGRPGGRKPKMTRDMAQQAAQLMKNPDISVQQICKTLGISSSTLYRYVTPMGEVRQE